MRTVECLDQLEWWRLSDLWR